MARLLLGGRLVIRLEHETSEPLAVRLGRAVPTSPRSCADRAHSKALIEMTLPRRIESAEQFEAQTHREKERTMNKSTKLAILLSLALTAAVSRPVSAATIEEQISERLNSVERENAELKQRLKLIESSVAK